MKRILPLSMLFITVLFILYTTEYYAQTSNSGDRISKLQHQVDSLSAKVAELENKVKKLEDGRDLKTLPFIIPKGDFKKLPKGTIPKEWQERKYQGQYYYVVPLEKNGKKETDKTIK